MQLTFCGTASGGLTPPRACSCILLEHEGRGLLLDCGPGATERIMATGFRLDRIEQVLISHLHMDHVHGLPELFAHSVFPKGHLPAVQGPPGTGRYVSLAAELTGQVVTWPGRPPGNVAVPVRENTDGERFEALGIGVTCRVVPHAPEVVALARRLEAGGRTLVYSGDTRLDPEIMTPLCDGADVLVHECYSNEALDRWAASLSERAAERMRFAWETTHSEIGAVAKLARDAGVRHLVLTHLSPWENPRELAALAAKEFAGTVTAAMDGVTLGV